MKIRPCSSPRSCTATMLGWASNAAACASRWNRCFDSSLRPGTAGMVLIATSRLRKGSMAL